MSAALQRLGYGRDRHLALGHLDGMPLLLRGELRSTSTFATTRTGRGDPCHDAFLNQCPLILRQGRKHMQGQCSMRGARINGISSERLQPNAPLLEVLNDFEEMLGIAAQAVQLPHDEHIVLPTGPDR